MLPIAVSSTISAAFGSWALGGPPRLSLNVGAPELMPLLPALFISGFVFGTVALIYMKMIFGFSSIPAKHKLGYLPFALFAAAVTGVFGVFFPEGLGLGVGIIFNVISHEFTMTLILTVLRWKVFSTSIVWGVVLFVVLICVVVVVLVFGVVGVVVVMVVGVVVVRLVCAYYWIVLLYFFKIVYMCCL